MSVGMFKSKTRPWMSSSLSLLLCSSLSSSSYRQSASISCSICFIFPVLAIFSSWIFSILYCCWCKLSWMKFSPMRISSSSVAWFPQLIVAYLCPLPLMLCPRIDLGLRHPHGPVAELPHSNLYFQQPQYSQYALPKIFHSIFHPLPPKYSLYTTLLGPFHIG